MLIHAKTDRGLKRTQNQDAFNYGLVGSKAAWAVVCDGMGGSAAGNVASAGAASVFSTAMTENFKPTTEPAAAQRLMVRAIDSANAAVFQAAGQQQELEGMGTTVVACAVINGSACIANVGDSRAYLLRGDSVTQLTTDHSVVQSMVEKGQLTADEAKNHPNKNIITRAVGVAPDVTVDLYSCELQPQDVLLLCTDGLTNCVNPQQLAEFAKTATPQQLPEQLIAAALAAGGPDNITVVVLRQE